MAQACGPGSYIPTRFRLPQPRACKRNPVGGVRTQPYRTQAIQDRRSADDDIPLRIVCLPARA